MKTEAQIYLDAIEVLKRDGWCKHTFTDSLGRHCMRGAILIAGGDPFKTPQLEQVCGTSLFAFNDDFCRARRDVVAAFSIAADLAS